MFNTNEIIKEKQWILHESTAPSDRAAAEAISRELGIGSVLSRLLVCRGFTDAEGVSQLAGECRTEIKTIDFCEKYYLAVSVSR